MNIIEHLNSTVWAKIDVSAIHGVGVVTIRDIPKGQKVYELKEREWLTIHPGVYCSAGFDCYHWKDLDPAIRTLIAQRWPLASKGESFWSPNDDAHLPSFLNHSDTPNIDSQTYCALQLIPKGTELTESYGNILMVQ